MPNDLSVRPPTAPPIPAARESAAGPAAPAYAASVSVAAESPNPTLRLDPELGIVVIEFHNQAGSVTQSIPGARQLEAYRTARDLNGGPDIAAPKADGTAPGVHNPATRQV